jgi:hypothetical protein
MKRWFWLSALALGCTSVATSVPPDQKGIPASGGIVMGRLGFVARKKMTADKFQLAAVQVPDGDRYWIHARLDGETDEAGSFFVTLPPGHYRLTQWTATGGNTEWAGEDVGLAIEVMSGEAVCVGALYVHPRERQMFRLEQAEDPPAVVRDECEALGTLLRQRSPALVRAALVKVAQPVSRRRS